MSRSHHAPLRTLDADPVTYILHTLCDVPPSGLVQSPSTPPIPSGSHLNRRPRVYMAGVNTAIRQK